MPGPSYIIAILAHDTSHRRKQQEPPPDAYIARRATVMSRKLRVRANGTTTDRTTTGNHA
jgi:hypothetical protein